MGQVVETGTKECPYCSERVRAEAVKCRFCGEWFQDRTPPEAAADRQSPAAADRQSRAVEEHDASPRPEAHTSGRAIASFLFALLGGGLGAIPAVVLGRQAHQEIRKSEGRIKGDGWAYWGLVLGGTQLAVLGVVALVLFINAASEPSAPPRPSFAPAPDGPIEVQTDYTDGLIAPGAIATKNGEVVSVTFTLTRDPGFGTCWIRTFPHLQVFGAGLSLSDDQESVYDKGSYVLDVRHSSAARMVTLTCSET